MKLETDLEKNCVQAGRNNVINFIMWKEMRVSLTHIGHVSLRLQLSEVASYTCSFHNQLMKIDNNKDRTMPTKKILPNSPIIAQMFGPCRKYHISIMLEE